MSEHTSKTTAADTSIDEVETKTKSKYTEQLESLIQKIRIGAANKGGFNLNDIEHLMDANTTLTEYFDNDPLPVTTEDESEALDILMRCSEHLTATGIYSFETSLEMIAILKSLDKVLSDNKTPEAKIASMRKKNADKRAKSKKHVK
jgi:hypothetical protein